MLTVIVRAKRWWVVAAIVVLCVGMVCGDANAAIRRILLVGDSWPMFMWSGAFGPVVFWEGRAFQETLIERGYGQWEEWGQWTALGTSMATDWGANLVVATEYGVIPRLDLVEFELEQNATIDIVHLCLGGNDLGRGDYSDIVDYDEYQMQTLTFTGTPTGGTFTLTFEGETTGPIAHDADPSAVQSELEALTTVGAGNVEVTPTSGGPTHFIWFKGVFEGTAVPMLTADASVLVDSGITMYGVEFDYGCYKSFGIDSPAEDMLFEAIAGQIRIVVETALNARPDVRVALCDYDYMNDEGHDFSVMEKNLAGMRLAVHKAQMIFDLDTQPEYNGRVFYFGPAGLMQYTYGYPNPLGVGEEYIYGPMGTPGTGGTIEMPTGYPDYIPGGDIDYPSPQICILSGVGGGDIHLNKNGYWTLARYCIDEKYGEWLDLPKVISVAPATPNPILPGEIYNPTGVGQVAFEVTFSEQVNGVDVADFEVIMGGGVSNALVAGVSEAKDAMTYTVTVNTGSGDGTLGLAVIDNDSITANDDGSPLAGAANGYFAYGGSYDVDRSVVLPVAAWPLWPALLVAGALLMYKRKRR